MMPYVITLAKLLTTNGPNITFEVQGETFVFHLGICEKIVRLNKMKYYKKIRLISSISQLTSYYPRRLEVTSQSY